MSVSDGELMKLVPIEPKFTDFAWQDGASSLGESCEEECTPDQLKMLLSKGERTLIRIDDEDKPVGWGAVRVDQLPNLRVLHITNMTAKGCHFERFFGLLNDMARLLGCSRIRCSAKPLQSKLFQMMNGFKPVYETLEIEVKHESNA